MFSALLFFLCTKYQNALKEWGSGGKALKRVWISETYCDSIRDKVAYGGVKDYVYQ